MSSFFNNWLNKYPVINKIAAKIMGNTNSNGCDTLDFNQVTLSMIGEIATVTQQLVDKNRSDSEIINQNFTKLNQHEHEEYALEKHFHDLSISCITNLEDELDNRSLLNHTHTGCPVII
jgi:hypothetical protein